MDETEGLLDRLEERTLRVTGAMLSLDAAVRAAIMALTEQSTEPTYDVINETALLVRMIGFCERTAILRSTLGEATPAPSIAATVRCLPSNVQRRSSSRPVADAMRRA